MSDAGGMFVRSNGAERTVECALVWHGLPMQAPESVPLIAVDWSDRSKSVLNRIARKARELGKDEGKELPYRDLRAAFQARVPGLVLLRGRVLPMEREADTPIFATSGPESEILRAAHLSVGLWVQTTLRSWAERLEVDPEDIDDLEGQAEKGGMFEVSERRTVPREAELPDVLTEFRACVDPMLGICATVLDGRELFPGLGPVHRIIARDYDNTVSFETMPTSRGDDLFSLFVELSVETRPSSRRPILVVRAGKRVWCREFPGPSQLFGRKAITLRAVITGERTIAVSIDADLDKEGKPKGNLDALILSAGRLAGESLAEDIEGLVKSRGRLPSLFVGVPFRYGYRPKVKVEGGITLQDQLDVFREVSSLLAPFGFRDVPLRVLDRIPDRPAEQHTQADLESLIAHHFGRVSRDDLPSKIEELFGSAERVRRGEAVPVRTVDLGAMIEANKARIARAFGRDRKVVLVLVCRREQEERIIRSMAELLFGGTVEVVRYALPDGVHGSRQQLDGDLKLTRRERAERRTEAWRPLAEQIGREHPRSPVIVQAAKEYDKRDEEELNKHCGRNALASIGGCSVQYLLPPDDGRAGEYLHRLQAAFYDLLFAHAGLGPVPARVISSTFPELETRPKTILGVFVASQARSRRGRPTGAEIAVAGQIDVETGRISARIGYVRQGGMDTGRFDSLSGTLVEVAKAGQTSLGKPADRRKHFMAFLRDVVSDTAAVDPNAVVLLDATNVSSLWNWLSDKQFSSDVFLFDASERPPASWSGLRFVRVREQIAGRIAVEKERSWIPVDDEGQQRDAQPVVENYATAIERLVECTSTPEDHPKARHYLAVHGFGIRNRGARGQSVYRTKPGFKKAGRKTLARGGKAAKVLFTGGQLAEWTLPSRIPAPLEITFAPANHGSDADPVAGLIFSLRSGYSHTADGTALPAPLSFKSKILDYMDRYGIHDEEAVEEPEASDSADTISLESDPASDLPSTFAEVRKWFEGTSEFDESDIPLTDDEEIKSGQDRNQNQRVDMSAQVEQVPMDDGKSEPVSAPEDERLDAVLSPSLKVPSFVTPDFLQRHVPLTNRDIRQLHDSWGKVLGPVTGIAWPKERPSLDEFYELFAEAISRPAFVLLFGVHIPQDAMERGRGPVPKKDRDAFVKVLAESAPEWKERAGHYPMCHPVHVGLFIEKGGDLETALGTFFAYGLRCTLSSQQSLDRLVEDIRAVADATFDTRFHEARDYLVGALACLRTFGGAETDSPMHLAREMLPFLAQRALGDRDTTADEQGNDMDSDMGDVEIDEIDEIETQRSDVSEPNYALLAERLRSPSATLPAACDEKWFADHIHFVASDIRRIHEAREWIRCVTGFPWPEVRPAVEDMPGLYVQAMRFPAFSLFAQYRFFGKTTHSSRGFPKASILRSIGDSVARLQRDPNFVAKVKADIAPLKVLAVLDQTANVDSAVTDLLSMAGRAGPSAICDRASLGLDEVIKRGGSIGEAGSYVLDVVSPFVGLGSDLTISEAFTSLILTNATVEHAIPPVVEHADVEGEECELEAPRESMMETADAARPVESEGRIEDAIEVGRRWGDEANFLRSIAEEAVLSGPNATSIEKLRSALETLTWLKEQADALAPHSASTKQLVEKLRNLIASVSASLVDLLGDEEDVSVLESGLSGLADEVPADLLAEAEASEARADNAYRLARDAAEEIERNEQSFPRKKAYDLNQPLLQTQEAHLRDALKQMGLSIDALRAASFEARDGVSEEAAVRHPAEPRTSPAQETPQVEVVSLTEAQDSAPIVEPELPEIQDEFDDGFGDAVDYPISREAIEDIPPPMPSEDPVDAPAEDPLRDNVIETLDKLFVLGEFGLAYHLASVITRLMPGLDLIYDPLEFRLAAAAGRYAGFSGQELEGLLEAREEAREIAQKLDGRDDARSNARRTMLLAGAVPAALFRQDDAGAAGLVDQIKAVGSTSPFFQLVSAVDENRKRNFPITGANLAAAAALAHEKEFVETSVAGIRESIEGFKAARFRFTLGERIKHALLLPDGVLGKLERGISSDAHKAVREAAAALATRDKAFDLLSKLAEDMNNRQEVDGPARERLIALLTKIGQQCEDLHASMEEMTTLRRGGSRFESITRLRDLVVSGIERVKIDTTASSGDALVDAAYSHANRILANLLPIFRGRAAGERDTIPLAVSLHAPLLWLPGLFWTGGWLPSPYETEDLVKKILDVRVPLLGDDPAASLEAAFEARKKEGAFVAATMLLNVARWFGVSAERTSESRAKLEADNETRKANVRGRLQGAMRLVDRMRRMAIGGLDQSNRLKETLETIDPSRLPVQLPIDFLPEAIIGDPIEDFNAALARIDGVEKEAKRELDKAEEEYARRIQALSAGGQLEGDTVKELRSLLASHDLPTLADWLNMMEKGENRRPPSQSGPLNRRLLAFRENMPSLGQVELHQLGEVIKAGERFGPLDYSVLDEEQRADAARALGALITLKQSMKGHGHATHVQAHMMDAVSALFYEVSKPRESDQRQPRRQIYVYDAKVAMPPADPSSLVLPEFGSNTQGTWRIVIVGGTTVSTSELIALSEGSSTVIVIVLGYLNKDRRAQIRSDLIKKKRSMLFVDEALIASALADPEDRRRALVEIAQGYAYADPYKDYGRAPVPPEMFKGRTHERAAILEPFGSYVVYGGRRLGKTALLRHIASIRQKNTEVAFVDLFSLTAEADVYEKIAGAFRPEVMSSTVRSRHNFVQAIQTWLAQDDRRRVLLLLDEADTFVRNEAENKFPCIDAMLQLQAETGNRFKFVLAGLHNVSRAIRAENSPLAQISNNALRIGPLVDRDVADAEFLVRGPLAAMGWEFERREDVWRILSFTNYYPVLIQVFCQELIRLLHDEAMQGRSLGFNISAVMVEKALSSSDVRRKLFETFDKTISDIEQRYKLLTYILARRELIDRESGMSGEGLTASEVADQAISWWPKAFPKGSDPIEIEYLLEEMEGFGISRRVAHNRFALRSRMLLELMATNEDDLDNKLNQFVQKDAPPRPFDPKNHRRVLGPSSLKVASEGHVSPLTDGQVADLLTQGAERPVSVVFGCLAAGIHLVEAALISARLARDAQVDVEVKSFLGRKDFLDYAKTPIRAGRTKALVVSWACHWTPEWVIEAERLPLVRNGSLRVIFVGGPKHAQEWASDPVLRKRDLPNVRRVKLRPWTRSFLAARMEERQVVPDLLDAVWQATGGWSEFVEPLVDQIVDKSIDDAKTRIAEARQKALDSANILEKLGVPTDLSKFMGTLAQYSDGSTVTTRDFQDLCEGENVDPKVVGAYGDLVGILSFPPDEGGDHLHRRVDFNALALAALTRME